MSDRQPSLRPEEIFEHGRLPNIHPGEILREEFLEPLGMTAYQLAKGIGVDQTRVSEILHGKRAITPDTALRLARFLGTSEQMWLSLQARYDLEEHRDAMGSTLDAIKPHKPAAA